MRIVMKLLVFLVATLVGVVGSDYTTGVVGSDYTTAYNQAKTRDDCVEIYKNRTKYNYGPVNCKEALNAFVCIAKVAKSLNKPTSTLDNNLFPTLAAPIDSVAPGCFPGLTNLKKDIARTVATAAVAILQTGTPAPDNYTPGKYTLVMCVADVEPILRSE
ncbi:hypothetical protein BsWGS_25301 [Bradybaena similaris]